MQLRGKVRTSSCLQSDTMAICTGAVSTVVRYFLIATGWLSVTLGVIGIVVPLLPTTPFILLAAACFAKSSPRFHQWLLGHKFFGPIINSFKHGQGIPRHIKIRVIILMWITLSFSMLMIKNVWVSIVLITMGIGLTTYLWWFQSQKNSLDTPTS